ncbi:MAG: hypothetical protein AAF658_21990, partial [Myxococcota bacterium]
MNTVDHLHREKVERATDSTILLLCLLGIGLASFALVRRADTGFGSRNVLAPPIGRLTVAVEQLRRRPQSSLVWRDVTVGATIYDRDTVFVPPLAYGRITFDDGTEIVLDAESLTVIERGEAPGDLEILLQKGALSGLSGGGGKVRVVAGSTEAELSNGARARLSMDAASVSIDVAGGEATIRAGGRQHALGTGEVARIENGALEAAKMPVILTRPRASERVTATEARQGIAFEWQGEVRGALEIVVSKDRRFQTSRRVEGASSGTTMVLEQPGRYYWKLVDSSGESVSRVSRFWVVPLQPTRLVRPRTDATFTVEEKGVTRLQWMPVASASEYRVEVFDV